MSVSGQAAAPPASSPSAPGDHDIDAGATLRRGWRLLIAMPMLAGLLGLAVAFMIPPMFTARTTLLPPQQAQSSALAALASLGGALGGLAGGAAARTPADQFVALMRSHSSMDALIDRFGLVQVYDVELRFDARRTLEERSRMSVGRKDGLITVEVDDRDPKRAAELANAFVDELRRLTSTLAISEAQQRRVFFETQLRQARDGLSKAQQALQASGFDQGTLRAEPRAAAEAFARVEAQLRAAELRLQALRTTLAEGATELRQAQAAAAALRSQLATLERPARGGADADYIDRYREFKYQETLFETFARQYEAARLDESREGALLQVVDKAVPPERKSKPSRALIALGSALAGGFAAVVWLMLRARPGRQSA